MKIFIYISYIVATAIGLSISTISIIFATLRGLQFAYIVGAILGVAHIGSFLFAYRRAKLGEEVQAVFALALPPFLVAGALYIFSIGKYAAILFEREPPAFTLACKTAGMQFYKAPTSPVHSIAYDWDQHYAPTYNQFLPGFDGRLKSLAYSARYIIDAKNRRACGVTGKDSMDEQVFVLKAIGLQ